MSANHRSPKYDIRNVNKLTYEELLAQRLTPAEAATVPRHPVVVILDDIRSLYNVGSIFRTADAFHIGCVATCGFTPAPPRPEISKTALGADTVVPTQSFATASEAIAVYRAQGYTIMAAEIGHGSRTASELTVSDFPIAVVLGNELTGISNDVLSQCDGMLEIPMFGTKHSLNVAVATGIILSDVVLRYRSLQP
jgi:tRNA G18 (ribose-2'-O)-methylase SpoU